MPETMQEYLASLPDGTQFWVINGQWRGKIVEREGRKYILAYDKMGRLMNEFPALNAELDIVIIKKEAK